MLSHTGTRVLETPRLVLRRFEEKDAEGHVRLGGRQPGHPLPALRDAQKRR